MNAASLLLSKSSIRIYLLTNPNHKYRGSKILGNPGQPEPVDTG